MFNLKFILHELLDPNQTSQPCYPGIKPNERVPKGVEKIGQE